MSGKNLNSPVPINTPFLHKRCPRARAGGRRWLLSAPQADTPFVPSYLDVGVKIGSHADGLEIIFSLEPHHVFSNQKLLRSQKACDASIGICCSTKKNVNERSSKTYSSQVKFGQRNGLSCVAFFKSAPHTFYYQDCWTSMPQKKNKGEEQISFSHVEN